MHCVYIFLNKLVAGDFYSEVSVSDPCISNPERNLWFWNDAISTYSMLPLCGVKNGSFSITFIFFNIIRSHCWPRRL
jgi:hypothetical protein